MTNTSALRRLSVLLVSPPAKAQGGVSVFARTLKQYLQKCDVTSLSVGREAGGREGSITSGVRLAVTLCRLIYYVGTRRCDVVHVNPSLNYKSLMRDGVILLLLRAMRFKQVMVWFHGWDPAVEWHMRRGTWCGRFFVWLLAGVKCIVVLAPEFRQSLVAMGIEGSRIVVGSTMFDEAGMGARLHDNEGDGRRRILFMSRYDARKGIYELLDAFTNIAGDFPDAELIFAGDGPEYSRLRGYVEASKLAGRIRLCSYATGNTKSMLLAGCEIFALPTYYPEGMPIALLEAMAAGMPVLTAKAGGIRHIASDPENGVVLEVVTAKTVEAGLRRLLNDRGYCRETGQRNAEYARKRYEANIVTAQIEKWYHEIAFGRV